MRVPASPTEDASSQGRKTVRTISEEQVETSWTEVLTALAVMGIITFLLLM